MPVCMWRGSQQGALSPPDYEAVSVVQVSRFQISHRIGNKGDFLPRVSVMLFGL